ncbi:MAG: hypothetical protein AB7P49_00670 [Bdellovibrionales bacterium]
MAWTDTQWIFLCTLLETAVNCGLGIAYFFVAYFILNPSRLNGPSSTAVIWSKPLALLAGFGCFALGLVAFVRTLGFDSVSELIAENVSDTVEGVKLYDLRWVGSMLWAIFMAYLIALYNAFRDFQLRLYWVAFAVWAIFGYIILHATTWWQVVLLTGVGALILISCILATIGNTYVAFYLLDFSKWIMYSFFFGSMLTAWVILLLSSPYAISNWGVMGQVWPEYIFFVTQTLAAIITPSVAIYSFMYRIPITGDYYDLYGTTDPTVTALKSLLAEGQIVSKEELTKQFGTMTGSEASRAMSGCQFAYESSPRTPVSKAWAMKMANAS